MAPRLALYDLLSIDLILLEVCHNLPFLSLLDLAVVSKPFRSLVHHSPGVFRCLDLSYIDPTQQGPNGDDLVFSTEDFANGPTRDLFGFLYRRKILNQVQVLVLDHQRIPPDLLKGILDDPSMPVKILSLIGYTGFRHVSLFRMLNQLCLEDKSQRLQGIYIYGTDHPSVVKPQIDASWSHGVTSSLGATLGDAGPDSGSAGSHAPASDHVQNPWYKNSGTLLSARKCNDNFPQFPMIRGLHFDAVMCRGPKHEEITKIGHPLHPPRMAMVAVRGCQDCGSAPEGFVDPSTAPSYDLPLLAPVPRSPSIKLAQQPPTESLGATPPHFLGRCFQCLSHRWCGKCGRFWCENCYDTAAARVTPAEGTESAENAGRSRPRPRFKVHIYNGLCVEHCLVVEMYHGAGSGGMWG